MDGYEGYEPHSHYTPNAGYESGSSDRYRYTADVHSGLEGATTT